MKNTTSKEQLVLNMVNFHIVFEREFASLVPEIEAEGITPLLSNILNQIHEKGRTTAKEIGNILNLNVSNTSRSINQLFAYGYIEKKPCASDKRMVYITLSKKGLDVVSKSILLYQDKFFEKISHLSEDDLSELNRSFTQIRNLLTRLQEKPKEGKEE